MSFASKTLDMFVSAYGAEAGNLALKILAVGGMYLGGGIVPKILKKMQDGAFMKAFIDKGRLSELLVQMPVCMILESRAALMGAAAYAEARAARNKRTLRARSIRLQNGAILDSVCTMQKQVSFDASHVHGLPALFLFIGNWPVSASRSHMPSC